MVGNFLASEVNGRRALLSYLSFPYSLLRVSTTSGNTENLLEFEIHSGNLLEFDCSSSKFLNNRLMIDIQS